MFELVYLLILFPLGGLLLNILIGHLLDERWIGFIASAASGAAFVVAVLLGIALAQNDFHAEVVTLTTWIAIGGFEIPWAFQVDTLSVTMMLLVTGVGTLIHIYAVGYMHGDERFRRFFVYFNLFIVAMLLLVSGSSYLILFLGWEGVGLCSYLLIGFWFDRGGKDGLDNARAAKKAFVVNRIGDFGVMLGMFLLFWTTGSLAFNHVFEFLEVEGLPELTATAITLLLLVGVTGKSAQIPLYVWLPDAMAGPTPVSALIHAATMVTAGIYLIARSAPLFELAPLSSTVVTLVGAVTALWAGSVALGQYDIKKVLAYSTVSQLGFMVAAVGLGGYLAGMFHLLTHAFFKALLFLSSGSVIHGMEHGHHHLAHAGHGGGGHTDDHHTDSHGHTEAAHTDHNPHHADHFDPQDMRTMGGLRTKMPITFWVYIVGSLALAGVFPLAGFWSKDEILADAWKVGLTKGEWYGVVAYILLAIAAFFTAFYMSRQVFMVFFGKPRHEAAEHATESSPTMTIPLILLAVLAAFGGLLNLPEEIAGIHLPFSHGLATWLEHTGHWFHPIEFNLLVAGIGLTTALVAIGLGYLVYGRTPMQAADQLDPLKRPLGPLFTALENKWYVDEVYNFLVVRPLFRFSQWLSDVVDWKFWHNFVHDDLIAGGFRLTSLVLAEPVDKGVIDGFFNGLAEFTQGLARGWRALQNGFARTYALGILLGAVLLLSYLLFQPEINSLITGLR